MTVSIIWQSMIPNS